MIGRVYILQSGKTNYYKIGLTKDPIKRRINELQSGNPYRITAILVQRVHDMRIAEDILHRKYYKQRGIGEWFYFIPATPLGQEPEPSIDDVVAYIKNELNQEVSHRLLLKEMQRGF